MTRVEPCELPPQALLRKHTDGVDHTDCLRLHTPHRVSHAAYVEAFYTSWLFRLERWILALLVARPSTDAQARELAEGGRASFAAWSVEDRSANQTKPAAKDHRQVALGGLLFSLTQRPPFSSTTCRFG